MTHVKLKHFNDSRQTLKRIPPQQFLISFDDKYPAPRRTFNN